MPDGAPGGTAGGLSSHIKAAVFYYSGDTALFQEIKLFGRRHKIDVAFLCLGDHFTMDYGRCGACGGIHRRGRTSSGCIFDTFPPIIIDHLGV